MAEDAEKKNISRLDFNISDAINSLEKIDQKLKTISESSEAYAKKIGTNLGNAINSGNIINTSNISKSLNEVSNLSKSKADQLSTQLTKIKAKEQADINKIVAEGEQKRQTAAYKSALKQEEYNNRVENSTKSLYDRITEYARTYVIYQGFNQLRQTVSDVINEMVELEYQMTAIDRVLNDSSLNIDIYRDKLIQLAYDYGNSFDNVADITLRLAQAGYDADESLALSEKTLLALNTAELDATQATEDMVAVMAQWGLMTGSTAEQAQAYGNIIDKINKVADQFPTTSEDILEALKKTSSAFNLAGASIDETIATIVAAETASQRGGKAIGTALSNIVQQLKADNRLDLAEEMGLDFFTDASKTEFKPIMDIFAEMSEMMQNLKNQGKENSVEMQNLLEMFTVFRRNIGSSLLGEMAGEDSTYAQVLESSLSAIGYSIQENSKHMQTAKAAQAQFNAELLKLKTQVWDEGLEDVFRDMLNLGTNLVSGISDLIDKFGVLPVTIGTVTAALTTLKGGIKAQDIIALTSKVKDINTEITNTGKALEKDSDLLKGTSKSFQNYVASVDKGKISLKGYAGNLVLSTAKTVLLTTATIALNAALTMGLSAAITLIVSAIDNWINAQEKAIEKNKEIIESSKDNANTINQEIESIQDLRNQYEELAQKDNRTTEENQKIYEIQQQINELIKDTGTQVELVTTKVNEQGEEVQVINDKYDEQLAKIKAIEYQKKKEEAESLKTVAQSAQELLDSFSVKTDDFWDEFWGKAGSGYKLQSTLRDVGFDTNSFIGESLNVQEAFDNLSFSDKIKQLQEWIDLIEKAPDGEKKHADELEFLKTKLEEAKDLYKSTSETIQEYSDALSELYAMSGYVDNLTASLQAISDSYDLEGPKKLIEDIQNINQQFSEGKLNVTEYFDEIEKKISEINLDTEGQELEAYQAIFASTTQSLSEGLESLISGLESGTINFSDYAKGVKEAADNTLALRIEQNNLNWDEEAEVWRDAAGGIDTVATALQEAKDGLDGMGSLLTTIGDNYDYIAEHANEAGEAMFNAEQVGTVAYTNLANSMAASLNQMRTTNEEAYNAIVNKVYEAMGTTANEVANADTYITEALNGNAQALNVALNESAKQVAQSTNDVATSLGNVLTELGNAISNFTYNITATPYIEGGIGLKTDENGVPTGLKLPTFGFDIYGTGGESVKNLGAAISQFGEDLTDYASNKFTYTQLKSKVEPYKPYSGGSTTTPSSSKSTGGSSSRDTSESDAQKAAEEAYNNNLSAFEDYVNEKERLEQRWVDKQKELGQLSNEDYLYITQQRIERYKKYLQEVENATWMSEEDKLRLTKEYSEKIEDLQVDYLGYLKDQLDEQIEALEEANEEKIKLIEEEADARIEALEKVEDETSRIRDEEDYKKERQSILDEIAYWEQRTGREAQESLKEAKEELKELDEEWARQLEDWSIEDQIAQIEEERDAQIASIEAQEKAEIDALQAIYDEKVRIFAETGQIIYENSVIQSQALYNAYKTNFIDPIASELANLNQAATAPAPAQQQYETYTIRSGDTLSAIAKRYGTTVDKIMAANPYIKNKNKIYTGNTLQIPKFHEGGIFGGNYEEGLALLKRGEVILKPSWSASLDRMMRYFDNMYSNNQTSITNGPTINVDGDLIKIEANVKNQSDIDKLERRLEKMLKDKFNIKK